MSVYISTLKRCEKPPGDQDSGHGLLLGYVLLLAISNNLWRSCSANKTHHNSTSHHTLGAIGVTWLIKSHLPHFCCHITQWELTNTWKGWGAIGIPEISLHTDIHDENEIQPWAASAHQCPSAHHAWYLQCTDRFGAIRAPKISIQVRSLVEIIHDFTANNQEAACCPRACGQSYRQESPRNKQSNTGLWVLGISSDCSF